MDIIEAAKKQAYRYGIRVAELDDRGPRFNDNRKAVRRAWMRFRDQFRANYSESIVKEIVDSYWDGYCS